MKVRQDKGEDEICGSRNGRFERIRCAVWTVHLRINDKKESEARLYAERASRNGWPISFSPMWESLLYR
jgi:hypothetical protein